MEIKKNQTNQTHNIQNQPIEKEAAQPSSSLSQEQKKIASVGLAAIGGLRAVQTPPSINLELLAFELQEIEHIALFMFTSLGHLELFTGDPTLAVMTKIGNQYFVKEGHSEAIEAHLDKNNYQIGSIDFQALEKTVIPEELWGELHLQIENLKPLLQAIVPQEIAASEKEHAPVKEHAKPNKAIKQSSPVNPQGSKNSAKSLKWEQAVSLFLEETNKIIKSAKERHEKEKIEEQIAHKEEVIKKEIEEYEKRQSRIKESASKEEMISHLKDWTESLPPCPIRLLNAMTMWRELINKCVINQALG